jgi:hypothetical protein
VSAGRTGHDKAVSRGLFLFVPGRVNSEQLRSISAIDLPEALQLNTLEGSNLLSIKRVHGEGLSAHASRLVVWSCINFATTGDRRPA